MTDAYYDNCLGCGLQWDGSNLSPAFDPTMFSKGPNGLATTSGEIVADSDCLINPVTQNISDVYTNTFCNGLNYDCENGRLWYETQPCHFDSSSGGIAGANRVEGLPSYVGSDEFTVIPGTTDFDDNPCYEGMKVFTVGTLKFRYIFENPLEVRDEQFTIPGQNGGDPTCGPMLIDPNDPCLGNIQESVPKYGDTDTIDVKFDVAFFSADDGIIFDTDCHEYHTLAGASIRKFENYITVPFVFCSSIGSEVEIQFDWNMSGFLRDRVEPVSTLVDDWDMQFDWFSDQTSYIAKECT